MELEHRQDEMARDVGSDKSRAEYLTVSLKGGPASANMDENCPCCMVHDLPKADQNMNL
jgi:hypothetical protein